MICPAHKMTDRSRAIDRVRTCRGDPARSDVRDLTFRAACTDADDAARGCAGKRIGRAANGGARRRVRDIGRGIRTERDVAGVVCLRAVAECDGVVGIGQREVADGDRVVHRVGRRAEGARIAVTVDGVAVYAEGVSRAGAVADRDVVAAGCVHAGGCAGRDVTAADRAGACRHAGADVHVAVREAARYYAGINVGVTLCAGCDERADGHVVVARDTAGRRTDHGIHVAAAGATRARADRDGAGAGRHGVVAERDGAGAGRECIRADCGCERAGRACADTGRHRVQAGRAVVVVVGLRRTVVVDAVVVRLRGGDRGRRGSRQ